MGSRHLRWNVVLVTACAVTVAGCRGRRSKTPTSYDEAGGAPTSYAYVPPPPAASQPAPAPAPATTMQQVSTASPSAEQNAVPEANRKPAARAAYTEGVRLQEEKKYAEALVRFETAQKFFDAPTHLLHIAECQVQLGRLVEASETYEALSRKNLAPGAPEAFVEAQQRGKAELGPLRARVPTLRITTKPDASQLQGLQVNVNGVGMPSELLGIPRPLNPGLYRISATARGYATATSVDVPLGEKEQKGLELVLVPTGPRR